MSGPLELTVTRGTLLQWPVTGRITGSYGADLNGKPNDGIDIEVPPGAPVRASGEGRVSYAGHSEQYGNLVIISHNDVNHAVYGYLDSIDVQKGDTIERDQLIGIAGIPEGGDTPTLHFELRLGPDHASIDPIEVLGEMPALERIAFVDTPETYRVKAGDTLTDIAKETYGISDDPADIGAAQNAMDHIASLNPRLAEGVRANHLTIGEEFIMPTASALETEPAIKLNHTSLDRDMARGHLVRGEFHKIDGGDPIVFHAHETDTTTEFTIGKGGTLSQTIFDAARQDGITLTNKQLYQAVDRVAEANDIDNPDVVRAGQKVEITRDMYGIGSP